MKKIILASNSPRRRELLHLIAPDFEIAPPVDVREIIPSDMPVFKAPEYLSRIKSDAYSDLASDDTIIITADTVVIIGNQILGKPHSRKEAIDMLTALSNRWHDVVTGVTLRRGHRTVTFSVTTAVHFTKLSADDIQYYVDNYRPMDKAGAYGIQEWIGAIGIDRIQGDYYNVMGLPLQCLNYHLRKIRV